MNLALAFKAEVVLAIQLITRHRAPRLVLLLVASLALVMLSGGREGTAGTRHQTILLVAGSLGAVAGSRLLARGGPLAAARGAATSSMVPAIGRVTGVVLLIGPIVLPLCVAVLGPAGLTTTFVVLLHGAATVALTMALTPAVGASSAAALGFLAALVGGVRPSQVGVLLSTWPFTQTPAVILWNTLPLSWRAARWLADGPGRGDPWVLTVWLAAGLWAAAWAIERFPDGGGQGERA